MVSSGQICALRCPSLSPKVFNFLQLSEEDKARLLDRLQADSDAGTDQAFKWTSVQEAFSDHLVWAYAFLFHGFSFVLYSLSFFLVRSPKDR
jgi:hypothetical protein